MANEETFFLGLGGGGASKIVDSNYLGMCGNYSNLLFENVWIKNSTN